MNTATVGCLFCKAGCEICSPPQWPSWFKAGEATPAYQLTNVANGKHPLGGRLNDHGYCQGCMFAAKNGRIVCTEFQREVRLYWRSCEKYEEDPCQ